MQIDPPDALTGDALKPIAKVTGRGPSGELVELADWAAVRWAARRRNFLVTASPDRAVPTLALPNRTVRIVEPRYPAIPKGSASLPPVEAGADAAGASLIGRTVAAADPNPQTVRAILPTCSNMAAAGPGNLAKKRFSPITCGPTLWSEARQGGRKAASIFA